VKSFENWKDWQFVGPLAAQAFTKGVPDGHTGSLPSEASTHYVWLAAGAYQQIALGDDWYVLACLRFYLRDRPVLNMLFSDASTGAAGTFAGPLRPIMRVRADGSGSTQPILRKQNVSNGTWVRDNLDIGCFRVELRADYVDFIIEEGAVTVGGGRTTAIWTGFRIVSV